MTPDPLNRLVAQLAKLPGIGEKTAQRLAFHLLRAPPEYARELSSAIGEVVDKVRLCSRCFSLTEGELCGFCQDARRDDRLLCVVEGVADLMAVEKTREFKGRYHVLHGVLSPLEGIGPEQLRVKELVERLKEGTVEEVIVATNPDVEGEATALYLTRLLKPAGLKVSRLAQGLPIGGDLEF
ncbi:MAG TPA: recombination mediator RecR, partial [Myxococcaceae bacterium]|nr:recombination mediator RecR [Myxococcaceae bacterium]